MTKTLSTDELYDFFDEEFHTTPNCLSFTDTPSHWYDFKVEPVVVHRLEDGSSASTACGSLEDATHYFAAPGFIALVFTLYGREILPASDQHLLMAIHDFADKERAEAACDRLEQLLQSTREGNTHPPTNLYIRRYHTHPTWPKQMCPNPEGKWCRFQDVQQEITAREARHVNYIAELQDRINTLLQINAVLRIDRQHMGDTDDD